ncbi:unnamed protein product, partial [Candidula unifasciata]
ALNYGIFRRKNFNATTQYYMFYDMGSTSTTATIVGYNVVKTKEGTRSESNPQLTIKGVGFDRTLGGLEFTLRLRAHLAKVFDEQKKTTLKVVENDRALAKLLKEAERVKKVLSANLDHTAQVENLIDEKDMRIPVTRAELEHMTHDLTERVIKPIEDALRVSEITLPEISEIILMGGGTRMPKVQEILMEYLGRTELGKGLNTDEAAAMGAVYQAAYLGKGFKVKRFIVKEGNIYPISVEFEKQKTDEDADDKNRIIRRTLFGRMNPFPQKKVMTFNKHTKDFSFDVVYSGLDFLNEEDRKSFGSSLISRYHLVGVEDALAKNKDKAEARGIKAHFQMDGSGLLSLDRVESVFEKNDTADAGEKSTWSKLGSAIGGLFGSGADEEHKVEESPETPEGDDGAGAGDSEEDTTAKAEGRDPENADTDTGSDDKKDETSDDSSDKKKEDGDEKAGEGEQKEEEADKTDSEKKAEQEKKESQKDDKADNTSEQGDTKSDKKETEAKEKVPKVVSIKEIIKAVPEFLDVKDLSEERFKASKKKLAELRKLDQAKAELSQARNDLESFIFDLQDKLSSGPYEKCSTEEGREKLFTLISVTSEWFENADDAKKSDLKDKLKALKDASLEITKRVFELEERPKALDALKDALNQTKFFLATVKNFSSVEDPIYTQVEIETMEKLINDTVEWRDTTVKAQKLLKPHENPVLLVEDVGQKILALEREQRYLINKLKNFKPKAKPKEDKKKEDSTGKSEDNNKTSKTSQEQEDDDGTVEVEENGDDSGKAAKEAETKPVKKEKEKNKKSEKKEEKDTKADKKSKDKTTSDKKKPKSKRKTEGSPKEEEEILELDGSDTEDKHVEL